MLKVVRNEKGPSLQRVALVTWFPSDPTMPHGGVEAVNVVLARALARRDDLEVHVVTVDAEVENSQIYSWEGIRIHRLPRGRGSLLSFALGRGGRMIQAYLLQLNPDVVHAHDTFGIMTRGLNFPRVFTIHGFIHEDTLYAGGLKAKARALLWKRAELAAWAEQPHIISISPYVRDRLAGIAKGVIHEIENPVAEEYFQLVRDDEGARIFSAGSICRRKNTLGLVEAFSKLAARNRNVRLRLAGPVAEPAYADKVIRLIRDSGLEKQVDLLGSISAPAVREELSRASVFALLSFEEGAPMVIAEAMAAGVPVVASNRCGMPYMVRDGETGLLVEPDDPDEMADSLIHLLGDNALRTKMGARAREAAMRRYHPDQVAEQTLRVYKAAIVSHRKFGSEAASSLFPDEREADLLDAAPNDSASAVVSR